MCCVCMCVSFAHEYSVRAQSFVRGDAFMYFNKVNAHFHCCEVMHACEYVRA